MATVDDRSAATESLDLSPRQDAWSQDVTSGAARLSAREGQILSLVACGYTNKGVACELGISGNTVSEYLRRVFTKYGVHSRTQAVAVWLSISPAELPR